MSAKTDIPALRLLVLDVLTNLTIGDAYHIPDVQIAPTIDLLNLLPRFLDELQAMRAKWEFEHELAVGQAEEIERLDAEIDSLRRDLEDDGTHADVPSYVVPPADPLLANPIEKPFSVTLWRRANA